ncbi:hypothetical protein D3C81_2038880 [compost metagenome]
MYVIVPADIQCNQNVILTGPGADEQDRDICHLPQLLAQLESGFSAEVDIKQNKRYCMLL